MNLSYLTTQIRQANQAIEVLRRRFDRMPRYSGTAGSGISRLIVVTTSGTHSKGNTQDCTLAGGQTVSCYNNLADLATGTRCIAGRVNNQWELIQADCDGVI